MNAGTDNGVSVRHARTVIAGKTLETKWVGSAPERARTIVLLHEALGSLALWKDFPERLAERTDSNVLVYSRYGHGHSEALSDKRTIDYVHFEGEVVLPELLKAFNISNPVLLGHSDGASIAITFAGKYRDGASGLILIAPHVFVEDVTVQGVLEAGAAYQTTDLRQKLSRYHRDPDHVFHAWHKMWIDPKFREWSIEPSLSFIRCPTLLIQGEHDPYGTMAQLEAIRSYVPEAEILMLANCGHSPQREQREITLQRIAEFIAGISEKQNSAPTSNGCRTVHTGSSIPLSPSPCRPSYRSLVLRELSPDNDKGRSSNPS